MLPYIRPLAPPSSYPTYRCASCQTTSCVCVLPIGTLDSRVILPPPPRFSFIGRRRGVLGHLDKPAPSPGVCLSLLELSRTPPSPSPASLTFHSQQTERSPLTTAFFFPLCPLKPHAFDPLTSTPPRHDHHPLPLPVSDLTSALDVRSIPLSI